MHRDLNPLRDSPHENDIASLGLLAVTLAGLVVAAGNPAQPGATVSETQDVARQAALHRQSGQNQPGAPKRTAWKHSRGKGDRWKGSRPSPRSTATANAEALAELFLDDAYDRRSRGQRDPRQGRHRRDVCRGFPGEPRPEGRVEGRGSPVPHARRRSGRGRVATVVRHGRRIRVHAVQHAPGPPRRQVARSPRSASMPLPPRT